MKKKIIFFNLLILFFLTGNAIAEGFAGFITSGDPMGIAIGALVIMAITGIIAIVAGVYPAHVAGALAIVGLTVIIAILLTCL